MNLKTSFDGIVLKNPLMPASGPLVGDSDKINFLADEGVGGLVTKTISSKEPHIPRPCIYGGKDYIMNSELWSEHSYQTWIDEFLPNIKKANPKAPLIISVGYSKEDMELLIPLLDPFADAFEISTHYVGTDLSVIEHTVEAIRRNTKKPIYMKISPHLPDPVAFCEAILRGGANGVVAINSLGPTMKIDLSTKGIIYANDSGFVWTSGPAIKNLALATVYTIKQAFPKMTVIGVGGISSADDVLEFLLAGADGVQMLSAALLKGKQLYKKIIDDLPASLEKYGFSSIEDVINTTLEKQVSYDTFLPKLIEDKCIECMLCVKICPYYAISFKDKIMFDPYKCFSCGLCISKCPTKAIV
jgi:dihydroorotate dehydrogenase subfamily 1